MDQGAEKLKAAFASIKDEKEQSVAQLKTRKELPRQRPSMKARIAHGYASGQAGSKGAHKLSLMEKIRKGAQSSKTASMADLKKQSSTVKSAPQDFLTSQRQPAGRQQTSLLAGPLECVAAPPTALPPLSSSPPDKSYQERETRLRALTSGTAISRQEEPPLATIDGPLKSRPRLSSMKRKALPSGYTEVKRSRLAASVNDLF